ncbi:dihydrofolate reductase family protein [Arenibaculum sp.]|uniref:dihydrofolate reductase family protein n=1 Tax=Arenibaculum sp. TaxID=2865862 RepID=UPI002E121ECB|nr:dihydrofolate reductase family protein [Arenibaculum sp.]
MRRIVAAAFVSLDGVMQAPGGPDEDPTGGFAHGGWAAAHWDDAIAAAQAEGFSAPFDLLLGRKTYDIFAAHWPYVEADPAASTFDCLISDIARTFNAATKYVATHSPDTLSWENSRPLGSDVVSALRDLKKGDGPDLLVQGSGVLVQTLLANDLIDEFRLLVYPLVLGRGKRLFGDGTMPAAFRLTRSATSPSGVLIVGYERAGDVIAGSFAPETPSDSEIERRRSLA